MKRRASITGLAILFSLTFGSRAFAADDEFARRAQETNERQTAIDAIETDYGPAIAASKTRFFLFGLGGVQGSSVGGGDLLGQWSSTSPTFGGGLGLGFLVAGREAQVRLAVSTWGSTLSCPTCSGPVTGSRSFLSVAVDGTMRFRSSLASPVFFGVGPRLGYASYGAVDAVYTISGTAIRDSQGAGGLILLHGVLEGGVQLLDHHFEIALRIEGGYDVGGGADYLATLVPAWRF